MANVMLSLVVLKTRQLNALRKFYALLGIDLVQEQHGKGPVHFAGRVGDVVLEVYPLPDDGTLADATTRLGFVVANLSEVIDALKGTGAAIVSEPQTTPWGLRAVVRDPDGRAIEVCQR